MVIRGSIALLCLLVLLGALKGRVSEKGLCLRHSLRLLRLLLPVHWSIVSAGLLGSCCPLLPCVQPDISFSLVAVRMLFVGQAS